jgi:type IV pilus assembly protein PilA
MKKNNKGFSLVELIVVVLIMGIIAVALAPQVMKWVGTARENSDKNTAKDIKSAVNIAVADFQSQGGTLSANVTFKVTSAGVSGISNATLKTCVTEVLNGDYPTPADTTQVFQVVIGSDYSVTVSQVAAGASS